MTQKKSRKNVGIKGRFRFVKHNVEGLKGSGENDKIEFDDLWSKNSNGELVNKHPNRTQQDLVVKNKITRRGLSAILHNALIGHIGSAYVAPEITTSPEVNPFNAIFFANLNTRVDFDESDGHPNSNVPTQTGTEGFGTRTVLLSDTSGPDMQIASISYPTTDPYRKIRFDVFAGSDTPTGFATGSIEFPAKANLVDGDTFSVGDGTTAVSSFEFDVNGTGHVSPGDTTPLIDISSGSITTADDVKNAVLEAFDAYADEMAYTFVDGGTGTIDLTHKFGGNIGGDGSNDPWLTTSAFITITQPTGGTPSYGGVNQIDNLKIQQVGMASGVSAGNGATDNFIGVRATLGVAPTAEGVSDRVYHHEPTMGTLHHYSALGQTIAGFEDGYVQKDNDEVTIRSVATSGTDSINGTDDEIIMKNGAFTQADVGRSIDISGSASNDGRQTIETVISRHRITTVESLTTEGDGFTADIVEPNTGDKAFDGDLNDYVNTGVINLGHHWRGVSASAPNHVGRVWTSSKDIVGIRIVSAEFAPMGNSVDDFTIEYLDVDKAPTPGVGSTLEPFDDAQWTVIDSAISGEQTNIYNGKSEGKEFLFTTPPPTGKCFGIRINISAPSSPMVSELYLFEDQSSANTTLSSGVDDILKLAVDGEPIGGSAAGGVPTTVGSTGTFLSFVLGDITGTGAAVNNDVQAIVDAINTQVRGYGLEALRTYLGQLWIRATVAGDFSQLDIDSEDNGSTASTQLGLTALAGDQLQVVGQSQHVIKRPQETLSVIYEIELSADLT